jgi:dihydrolipoamide dehydrogenase
MVAVHHALGRPVPSMAPVPMAVYTFPEIASVGLAEHQVAEKGIPAAVGQFPLAWLGKAQAAGETDGFAKVIRHRETGELLGMQMIGHNAIECMAIAGDLLHRKATAAEATEIVFAHPSMSEAIREAIEDSMGEALHAPPRELRSIG